MTREEAIESIAQSVKSDVDMAKVADAIKVLELIPDNATNGDVIKVLFPDMYFSEDVEETGDPFERTIWLVDNVYTICFDADWWNAPYKAESEEKK